MKYLYAAVIKKEDGNNYIFKYEKGEEKAIFQEVLSYAKNPAHSLNFNDARNVADLIRKQMIQEIIDAIKDKTK